MDEEVLSFLYLPFLKNGAYSLYMALYRYEKLLKPVGYANSDEFLSLLGFDTPDFLLARKRLEGTGLLETYRKEEKDSSSALKVTYFYHLLPPASPKKFFADPLLRALLSQEVGEKRYFSLVSYFRVPPCVPEEREYENLSASFKDVYTLSVQEGDASLKPVLEPLGEKQYKNQSQFDKNEFRKLLKENQIPMESLKDDLKDIENAGTLYDIKASELVSLVSASLDSSSVFYPKQFQEAVRNYHKYKAPEKTSESVYSSSDSQIARLINAFNSLSPEDYLALMFQAKPSPYMLDEIEHLKNDLGLPNPVINALLDYSLKKTNMEFNVTFIDKVAYTLSGQNISDAYSAMVSLSTRDFEVNKRGKTSTKTKRSKSENKTADKQEVKESDVADLLKDVDL